MTMRGVLHVVTKGETLKDLKFALYLGSWKKLPDFSTLTPHREGSVPDNLVQVKVDDYKNEFGLVFTGKLKVAKAGNHTFYLSSDDGGRISIDGKKVVEYDGIHPAGDFKEGTVNLPEGTHDFRLEYFQAAGNIELYAAWKGPQFSLTSLTKTEHPSFKAGKKKAKDDNTGMPLAVNEEAVLYRNFITLAGNRSIGVGYPGGFNVAWDAETMNLSLVWRGAFIDAARHWNAAAPSLRWVTMSSVQEVQSGPCLLPPCRARVLTGPRRSPRSVPTATHSRATPSTRSATLPLRMNGTA